MATLKQPRAAAAPLTIGRAFALGTVEATPEGDPVCATAEALLEIAGEAVIVESQVIGWPNGRREVRVLRFCHPTFGWIGPARLPDAIGNEVAAEVLSHVTASNVARP